MNMAIKYQDPRLQVFHLLYEVMRSAYLAPVYRNVIHDVYMFIYIISIICIN